MTIKEVSEKYDITADTLRYYEKVGAIPPIERTNGGIRNYTESDISWILHAKCMRSAGLPVETIAKYFQLYKQGDETISERLRLLSEQKKILLEQKKKIDETLDILNYKISRYEIAAETGVLSWEESGDEK